MLYQLSYSRASTSGACAAAWSVSSWGVRTDELEVRDATPDDADGIARVYVETWRAAYAEILPAGYLARLNVEQQTKAWRRQIRTDDHVLVAVRDDDVIGFCSGGKEREQDPFFRSEIFTLYVAPAEQRAQAGTLLLIEMLRRLEARAPVIVWVLEENVGACRFYEALGAVPVRRRPETVGGKVVEKIGYAYFD